MGYLRAIGDIKLKTRYSTSSE